MVLLFFLFRLEYITHFLKACTRVMGLETSSSRVFVDDKRTTALDVFPACIDPSKLQGVLKTPAVRSVPVSLRQKAVIREAAALNM